MAEISRNAPCPCGSGKKHKHCCLGKADPKTRKRFKTVVAVSVVVIGGVAGFVGWYYGFRQGLLTGIAGTIGLAIYLAVRNPAPSRGRSGGDNIDFGR